MRKTRKPYGAAQLKRSGSKDFRLTARRQGFIPEFRNKALSFLRFPVPRQISNRLRLFHRNGNRKAKRSSPGKLSSGKYFGELYIFKLGKITPGFMKNEH